MQTDTKTGPAAQTEFEAHLAVAKGRPTVAVVGDFMVDVYHQGESSRMCPEAPEVPVVKVTSRLSFAGGAGNVAANLEAMGCRVIKQLGRYVDMGNAPRKNRLMIEGRQVARWDIGDECLPVEPHEYELRSLWFANALVISDYGKGAVTQELINEIARVVPGSVPVFVDSKRGPEPFRALSDKNEVTFFPNMSEYYSHEREYDGCASVVAKAGAGGVWFGVLGRTVTSVGSYAEDVVSVSGAGDVVLAAYVAHALRSPKSSLGDRLRFAMAAAAVAVEAPYTTVVSWEQAGERGEREEESV